MKIGTRESKLAMRQTDMFAAAMAKAGSDDSFEIIGIKSLGDIDLTSSLDSMDNIGAFVRELDDALRKKEIDVSVNSLKDIPILMDKSLTVGAVMKRDAVEDVILPCRLEDLPKGATVGSSSVRRKAILMSVRPDLKVVPMRGNIHTRLSKLDSGECDAMILAKAGLDRMGIVRPMFVLDPEVFVPAPAQGAIGVECRSDDEKTKSKLSSVDDTVTRQCVTLEREIMRALGAGCSSPVGINALKLVKGFRVRAVSFASGKCIRFEGILPYDYTSKHIDEVADVLKGESQ